MGRQVNGDDLAARLRRARIVCDNLANRVGALTAENIELLLRIHELENPEEAAGGDDHDDQL
jgi:hypothetical protein